MSVSVLPSPYVYVDYIGSLKAAEWPPFGKELQTRLTLFIFVFCMFVVLVVFNGFNCTSSWQ